jgi:hypothetical protein
MIAKLDTWGVVLAGHWNRMIFTPEWIADNLFKQDVVETEIALLPGFPARYRHPQVLMEAARQGLVFRPRFDTDESLKMAEEMASTALRDLPNTPLSGVGINFSFNEQNPPVDLLKLFSIGDTSAIEKRGWEVPVTALVRKLTGDQGTLNLTLGYDGSAVTIDMNYHTETPGKTLDANAIARASVANRTKSLRDQAVELIGEIYNLRLEGGASDE